MDGNDQNNGGFGPVDPAGFNPDPLGQSMPPAADQDPFSNMNSNAQNGFNPQAEFGSSPYQSQGFNGQSSFNNQNSFNSQGTFNNQNSFNNQGGFNNQNSFNNQNGFYGQNGMGQGGYQQTSYDPYGYQPQGSYDQGVYNQPQYYGQPQQPPPTPGFSIASLIVGILALLLVCCLRWWDLGLCIPAIVMGIIGLVKEPNGKGFAIAGIITGAIALLLAVVITILWLKMMKSLASVGYSGFQQMWEEMLEEAAQGY